MQSIASGQIIMALTDLPKDIIKIIADIMYELLINNAKIYKGARIQYKNKIMTIKKLIYMTESILTLNINHKGEKDFQIKNIKFLSNPKVKLILPCLYFNNKKLTNLLKIAFENEMIANRYIYGLLNTDEIIYSDVLNSHYVYSPHRKYCYRCKQKHMPNTQILCDLKHLLEIILEVAPNKKNFHVIKNNVIIYNIPDKKNTTL